MLTRLQLICSFVVCASVGLASAADFRTVGFSGTPVPNRPNLTFNSFISSFVTNRGEVVVNGTVLDANGVRQEAFFAEQNGLLQAMAVQGEQAPGIEVGANYGPFRLVGVTTDGHLGMYSALTGPVINETNHVSNWITDDAGAFQLVLRNGMQAATGDPDTIIGFHYGVSLGSSGLMGYRADLLGTNVTDTNNSSLWRTTPQGEKSLWLREGEGVPAEEAGALFLEFIVNPVVNARGQMAVIGQYERPGQDLGEAMLMTDDAIGTLAVARKGSHAPGTGEGTVFRQFRLPSLSDRGQIAFAAELDLGETTEQTRYGIWSGSPESLQLLVRSGDAVPGMPDPVKFAQFAEVRTNANGLAAFRALIINDPLTGASTTPGIWRQRDDGTLTMVTRTGQPAPGTDEGVVFDFNTFSTPIINSAGQVAFSATVRGPGVNSRNDIGLWATDSHGDLQLIVREGQSWDVDHDAATPPRIVQRILGGTTNLNEISRSLNDAGQIVFSLSFTDGSSGVFVSDTVAVPEPSVAVGLIYFGIIAMRRYASATTV